MVSTATCVLLAACCLLAAAGRVQAANKTVALKTLVLTTPGSLETDHIETVLRAYGAPWEKHEVLAAELQTATNPGLNMTSFLTNDNGSGKYGFIVAIPANVINIFGGVLSANQIYAIYDYQVAFNVRLATENPYVPTFGADIPGGPPGLGVDYVNPTTPAPPVVTAKVVTGAPVTTSGIKIGAPMDLTGLYAVPVKITNTTRTQPVTQAVTPAAYATGYTSVTTKFDTGREQFTAFYPCAAFASDCILTAHLYYAWGMHGILPGARDSLFSVQIDDLFLATEEPFVTTNSYRMTAADSQALATFAANVPALPAGSSFRIEFVYNNGGYIAQTQGEQYFNIWSDTEPADTLQTFQKTPGTGVSMMPASPDTSWWNATLWKTDPLYNEIAFGASGMQFFLGHHTFTHENMNNVTYNDAYQQIRLNQKAAAAFNTTNGKFNRFSQTAMVTPAISGIRNKDALTALMDAGITAGTGDTSWPHLRNQANPWQAQVLNINDNQTVNGFYIIPRSPTEVYYDVSTEKVEAQLYNWFYCCNTTSNANCPTNGCEAGKPFNQPSTWADILGREQARVMRLMLALRPEGHMFHQANARIAAGPSNQSLLRQWITKIVAGYSSKVTWPLQSLKLDDQLAFAKKRILRDACAPQYAITFDDVTKTASTLTVSSAAGSCDAPVMIASTAVTGANPSPRVLGSEPRLYQVTLPAAASATVPSTKTLTLGTATAPIKWA